ncbi:hypothetical protein GF389_04290 [Candidatus Dojkabacteria bacterium]|nr:hypothetical protein [Candidatus Dojkabacteria bacterium]
MQIKNVQIKKALLVYTGLVIGAAMILVSVFIYREAEVYADACGGCPVGWECWTGASNGASPGSHFCLAPNGFSGNASYPECDINEPGLRTCDGIPLNPGQTTFCTQRTGNPSVCAPGNVVGCTYEGGKPCGCDMNACEQKCKNEYADSSPGTYFTSDTCTNCHQIFKCSCVIEDITPPPPSDTGCPYNSTQARVHTSINKTWDHQLTLSSCPTSVIVGAFHDHTGQFANDTSIQVVGPGVNIGLPNEGTFTASSGEYTVYVRTRIPGTNDYYSEPACNAEATITCQATPPEANPDFRITKVATNDDGAYEIGEIVRFRVQIENTGDKKLKSIAYRDVFDNRYLRLLSVRGYSPKHPAGVNMLSSFTISNEGHLTALANNDITTQLGNLKPGELMHFDYEFRATNPSNRACNDVFANPKGLSEKQARDCVGITISTDL